MSTTQHHAVVATTWSKDRFEQMRTWTEERRAVILPTGRLDMSSLFTFGESAINGFFTVALLPDGSGEGWDADVHGDMLRDEFIAKLSEFVYDNGSNPWKWVEVSYGDRGQKLVRGNCIDRVGDGL